MQLQQEQQFSKTNLLRKCGLLAHTSAAFLKNCCTKKLSVACGSLLAVCMEKLSDSCRVSCETRRELLLEIPTESGSARLGHIPSLSWESQLPLKPYLSLQPLDFKGNCDSFDSLLDFCLVSLFSSVICSANVGYSPTPRQHF